MIGCDGRWSRFRKDREGRSGAEGDSGGGIVVQGVLLHGVREFDVVAVFGGRWWSSRNGGLVHSRGIQSAVHLDVVSSGRLARKSVG